RDFHVTGVQTCALPIFFIDGERHVGVGTTTPSHLLEVRSSVTDGSQDPAGAIVVEDSQATPRVGTFGLGNNNDILFGTTGTNDRSEERRGGKECRTRCQ